MLVSFFSRSKLYISDFSNFFVDKKNNKKQLQKIISLPTYKGTYLVEMPPLPKKKKRKEIMHSLPCARVFFCGQKLMVSATNWGSQQFHPHKLLWWVSECTRRGLVCCDWQHGSSSSSDASAWFSPASRWLFSQKPGPRRWRATSRRRPCCC